MCVYQACVLSTLLYRSESWTTYARQERRLKVAYYSFPKKKIKVLESVKLKQQEVSSEVLVTAIDVKCNFTEQINANQGKMLINFIYSDRASAGGLETRHFKGFFLKNQPYNATSKFQNFRKREKNNYVEK